MRNELWLIAVAATLAAAPAGAQENVAQQAANATNEVATTDANLVRDANLATTAPPVDNALEPAPPTTPELANAATADADDADTRGFPWGLLGLVGLIGLLGRRRNA